MRGVIIKGIAGFYYVLCEGLVYECKARGIFRKQGISPLVGDRVDFGISVDGQATVDVILPRTNQFDRPPVANVETMVLVMSARDPVLSLGLLDRFAVAAESCGAKLIICINKTDLAEEKLISRLKKIYTGIYPLFFVCGNSGEGIEELREALKGTQAALAGPSGVGKSTIANLLLGDEFSATGEISAKSLRGKNTTRHSEIFVKDGLCIFDTPGFTSFDPLPMKPEELQNCFPEFRSYMGKCRFSDCVHINEPDCALRDAVEKGMISRDRYRSYKEIFDRLAREEAEKY